MINSMKEIKVNFHYINKCDMHCYHCFERINLSKMQEQEVVDTFNALCKITKSINLVGGEVFTNVPLLKKLISNGLQYRVHLSVVTNGYQLLNNLKEKDYQYIIKNVKMIGISIDSFDDETNKQIGREVDGRSLSINKLQELRRICNRYATRLKINTVVTKNNLEQIMKENVEKIAPDIWKILQVVTNDEKTLVTRNEFSSFIEKNRTEIETKVEYAEDIPKAYLMINAKGQVYFNQNHYSINVNSLKDYSENNPSCFLVKLEGNGIFLDKYFERYSNNQNIQFNKREYHKTFRKKIRSEGNILFLDVESFTPRPSESKSFLKYTTNQLHFLYCGIVINQDMEILEAISDSVSKDANIQDSIDKSKSNTFAYSVFYKKFLDRLKSYKIQTIIVSGLDTEINFLLDLVYYIKDLSRLDYEYIQYLFNNIIDIQSVKKNNVIVTDNKKLSSRNINQALKDFRSDIFSYTRNGNKDCDTSHNISTKLQKLYLEKIKDIDFELEISKIRSHCYQDVFDDLELFYAYELLSRSSILSSV